MATVLRELSLFDKLFSTNRALFYPLRHLLSEVGDPTKVKGSCRWQSKSTWVQLFRLKHVRKCIIGRLLGADGQPNHPGSAGRAGRSKWKASGDFVRQGAGVGRLSRGGSAHLAHLSPAATSTAATLFKPADVHALHTSLRHRVVWVNQA